MVCEKITIVNPTGLHTRPAKMVVAQAKLFESQIRVRLANKEADLKSLIKLMKLGVCQNHVIELCCSGPDEAQALQHLKTLIMSLDE